MVMMWTMSVDRKTRSLMESTDLATWRMPFLRSTATMFFLGFWPFFLIFLVRVMPVNE